MSRKQWKRLEVLERLEAGEWTMVIAAKVLGLSVRQLRRLRRSYEFCGHCAVVHGNTERSPPNRISEATRALIVKFRQKKYSGFNDQHFTEKLMEEEKIVVSRATVQRILRAHGIASPRKRRSRRHRRRREREAQAGMMVQWDGSSHDWLEGRGPCMCLMGAIDDATGALLPGAHFIQEESSAGYLKTLYDMVRAKGVPWRIYMDKHSSLRRNDDNWTLEEELAGKRQPTQVGRAMEVLGIEIIYANSPEAKGRVERAWETLQDRLVSEFRLAGVSTIKEANEVLNKYRPVYNRRFAKKATDKRPAWRKLPKDLDLKRVCSFYRLSHVNNDNTIQYEKRVIDIPAGPKGTSYASKWVEVRHLLDGNIRVYLEDMLLVTIKDLPPVTSPKTRGKQQGKKIVGRKTKKKLSFREIVKKHQEATFSGGSGLRPPPPENDNRGTLSLSS